MIASRVSRLFACYICFPGVLLGWMKTIPFMNEGKFREEKGESAHNLPLYLAHT